MADRRLYLSLQHPSEELSKKRVPRTSYLQWTAVQCGGKCLGPAPDVFLLNWIRKSLGEPLNYGQRHTGFFD